MLKLWYMWAHSGIPKYETYVAYFINRLVVLLELLEIALKTPGEELARYGSIPEEHADAMVCGFMSWPAEPALRPCHSHSCKETGG